MGHVAQGHQVIAEEIAEDGHHVGYDAPLPRPELERRPAVVAVVESDERGGHENGKHIYHEQRHNLIEERQQAEVREQEQRRQSDNRQIER